jgi:hypothetical protein
MEIDKDILYLNAQYSTWNDQRFLHICPDGLNLSSSEFTSHNICNNISFVQLNDTNETGDINNINDTNDAHGAHYASGVKNRGLVKDDIFKVCNIHIDNNCDFINFFIWIQFTRMEVSKEISTVIVVPYRPISLCLRSIISQTLNSDDAALATTLIDYFYRMIF